jgi:hypothetical protein
MAGGISLFLLFVIIVVAIVLAIMFTGLGTALGLRRDQNAGEARDGERPTHAVVEDDGSSRAEPGNVAHR